MPEITGGQSTLLGGRACPEVAFLRELEEIASRFGKILCLVGFDREHFSRDVKFL